MKNTLLLFLISMSCMAQIRKDEPLVIVSSKPISVMDDDVTGWSLSLDGQWLSADQLIPQPRHSREKVRNDEAKLGLDNFEQIQMYSLSFGKDTLLAMVKLMETGRYKYPQLKKGWNTRTDAHYFVFPAGSLSKFRNLEDGQVQIINVPLLADGVLTDVSKNSVQKALESKLLIDKNYPRSFYITVQPYLLTTDENVGEKKIRFQMHTQNAAESRLSGVLTDYNPAGKSLYGSEALFDYMYYECDRGTYFNFFSVAPDKE